MPTKSSRTSEKPAKALATYRAKRRFDATPEPKARAGRPGRQPIFVVQEHHARRLHYDFRLEADGVLKSWAVPKEPVMDPAQKRLAVQVEDHPLAYARFAGEIPVGQYGAGTVSIWDHGTYENLLADKPAPQSVTGGIAAGRLEFRLHGQKLRGRFALIRMKSAERSGRQNWLLIKMKDEFARTAPAGAAKPQQPRPKRRGRGSPDPEPAAEPPAELEVTHPDKVMFPDAGIVKWDVVNYYQRIAPRLLPWLHDRPVTLERLPEGLGEGKPYFWQKRTPPYYPAWIPRVALPSEDGKVVPYVLVNDLPTLLYLVNQDALTFHIWPSRVTDLDRPDFVLFDLDPGQAAFTDVVAVAKRLHALLADEDWEAGVKTSGKSGLHVLVPWDQPGGFDAARVWAQDIARRVVEALPEQATVERSKVKRGRRVYVDVEQNVRGRHVVPPFVVRPVAGAPVSTPLPWKAVTPKLNPADFTLHTIFDYLAKQRRDPLAAVVRRFAGGKLARGAVG